MIGAQTKTGKFTEKYKLTCDPAIRLLDLMSELGEVAKEYLKESAYGSQPFLKNNASLNQSWEEELGDCLFCLADLANITGVDLDRALTGVLLKYEKRMLEKGHFGSE